MSERSRAGWSRQERMALLGAGVALAGALVGTVVWSWYRPINPKTRWFAAYLGRSNTPGRDLPPLAWTMEGGPVVSIPVGRDRYVVAATPARRWWWLPEPRARGRGGGR